jgi:hypothetical protein
MLVSARVVRLIEELRPFHQRRFISKCNAKDVMRYWAGRRSADTHNLSSAREGVPFFLDLLLQHLAQEYQLTEMV